MARLSRFQKYLITILGILIAVMILATITFYYKAYHGDFDVIKSMGGGRGSPDKYHICSVRAVAVLPYRKKPIYYYEIKVYGADPEIIRIMVDKESDLAFFRGASPLPIEWSPDSSFVTVKLNDATIRLNVRKMPDIQ